MAECQPLGGLAANCELLSAASWALGEQCEHRPASDHQPSCRFRDSQCSNGARPSPVNGLDSGDIVGKKLPGAESAVAGENPKHVGVAFWLQVSDHLARRVVGGIRPILAWDDTGAMSKTERVAKLMNRGTKDIGLSQRTD